MSEDRSRALSAGMDDHLTKPVHLDDIRNALKRWVFRSGGIDLPAASGRSSVG
jgi:CheY-like chemotaxis protein